MLLSEDVTKTFYADRGNDGDGENTLESLLLRVRDLLQVVMESGGKIFPIG